MRKADEEKIREIANEELDKRVKPKKVQTRGDPICRIEE